MIARFLLGLFLLLPFTASATVYTATATNLVMHQGDVLPPLIFSMSTYSGSYSAVFNGQPTLSTTATSISNVGTYPITIVAGSQSPVSGGDSITYVGGTLKVIAPDTSGAKLTNSISYPSGFFSAPAFAALNVTSNPVANLVGDNSTLNDRAFERLVFFSRWGADAKVNTVTSGSNCALTWVSGTGFTGIATSQPLRIAGIIYAAVSVSSDTSMTVAGTCPTASNVDARLPWNTVSISGTTVTATSGPSFAAFTAQSITQMIIGGNTYTISTVTDSTHITLSTAPPATSDTDAFFGNLSSSSLNLGARPLYLYFPAGTYLTSTQLIIPGSDWNFFGQGAQTSVIKLAPNSAAFQTVATQFISPQSVNFNQNFREHISSMGFEIGVGNAFAEALTWLGNNEGAMRNVQIWSDDSKALYGLNLSRGFGGPSMFEDVAVYGFQYGLNTNQSEYSLTMEKHTLEGQTIAGLDSIGGMKLQYRRVLAYEPPAVYVLHPHSSNSNIVFVDSEIIANGTPTVPAILNSTSGSSIYTHNVLVTGYTTSLSDLGSGTTQTWTGTLAETWTGTAQSLFDPVGSASALHLTVLETPSAGDDGTVGSWTQLGSNPTTWQATINSSSSPTVYLPPGQYASSAGALTINVPDSINHLQFFHSATPGGTPYTINLTVAGSSSTPLIIDGCLFNNCFLTQSGTRAVLARDGGYINYTSTSTANFFIDDALLAQDGNPLTIPATQHVWARQLNLEQTTGKHLICNSCVLWDLGYKTEHNTGTMADVTTGQMELLGGFWYMLSTPSAGYALFNVTNSNFFTTGQAFVNTGDGAPNQVSETRNGVTRTLPSPQTTTNQQLPMYFAFGLPASCAFSPTGGSYTTPQIVTVTCPAGLTAFYTTDGSTPSIAGIPYTAPIAVSTTQTLKVVAAQVGVMYQDVGSSSAHWKCVTNVAHTYGSLSCQAGGGVGSITPSNVVWNFGNSTTPMTETVSTTSSTGSTQMLFVNTQTAAACPNCTELVQDKIVTPSVGSTFLLNNEMDANINMLSTWNQFHTASLQCNQQAGILQWQIDNQQGSWRNTGITFGCPLSTTQQTEIRYGMHWTNGDTSCTGGFSCDSYDFLTICVGGVNGVGGTCHDFNLGPTILPGYTEPSFGQNVVMQDQPDLTNTTTSGANPTTATRKVWRDNVTAAYWGTTINSNATYTIAPITTAPANFSGTVIIKGQVPVIQ